MSGADLGADSDHGFRAGDFSVGFAYWNWQRANSTISRCSPQLVHPIAAFRFLPFSSRQIKYICSSTRSPNQAIFSCPREASFNLRTRSLPSVFRRSHSTLSDCSYSQLQIRAVELNSAAPLSAVSSVRAAGLCRFSSR